MNIQYQIISKKFDKEEIFSLNNDININNPFIKKLDFINAVELLDYSRENIINGFEEIFELSKNCKFNDCNHIDNDGCNIANLVSNGQININGMKIEKNRIEILQKINFISPYIELPKKLTVQQNLVVYGKINS